MFKCRKDLLGAKFSPFPSKNFLYSHNVLLEIFSHFVVLGYRKQAAGKQFREERTCI